MRHFLVVILSGLVCIPTLASRAANQRSFRAIVREVQKRGGIVSPATYSVTLTGWKGTAARGEYRFLSDLARFSQEQPLRILQIANRDVTDETLDYLSGWQDLEELDLDDTAITDHGLVALDKLTSLTVLRLERTQVTDRLFVRLHGLDHLRLLQVAGTKVTREACAAWQAARAGGRCQLE